MDNAGILPTLVIENGAFLAIANVFLLIAAWAWRDAKPYHLPDPLPGWFRYWFLTVQIFGTIPPAIALGWGIYQGNEGVIAIFTAYFVLLGIQILTEVLALRQFHSVIWVMVPYLYVGYRLWQLYEGVHLLDLEHLAWLRFLLLGEMALWSGNYLLDLAQLPRLLRWEFEEP
jgi:hypothetical protein